MAIDMFLWFPSAPGDGVRGETTDDIMKENKAIELQSFSLGASAAVTIGSKTTGASGAKADFSQVTVSKTTDKASIDLFGNLSTGTHFPEAVIALRKTGTVDGVARIFLQYNFKLVFISSMQWSGSPGSLELFESMSFDYGSIKMTYFAQNAEGVLEEFGNKMWSRTLNKATDAIE